MWEYRTVMEDSYPSRHYDSSIHSYTRPVQLVSATEEFHHVEQHVYLTSGVKKGTW